MKVHEVLFHQKAQRGVWWFDEAEGTLALWRFLCDLPIVCIRNVISVNNLNAGKGLIALTFIQLTGNDVLHTYIYIHTYDMAQMC